MRTQIDKRLLADEHARELIMNYFRSLSEEQEALLAKYADEPVVRQFVWLASACANELKKKAGFAIGSDFMIYARDTWRCYVDLPAELKDAFGEHWDALDRVMAHVEICTAAARYVDEVVTPYVNTRDPGIGFIKGTLELFDMIDRYYLPDGGAMTEEERRFILEKTCDAYRPLLRERWSGVQPFRDRVALEVFERVHDWGDDDCFDKLENYPVGPDISAEDIMGDIDRVVGCGFFDEEEVDAYRHLKIRDLAELIRININFDYMEEARSLYACLEQLVNELGDGIKPQYYKWFTEIGIAIEKAIEQKNARNHAKR